MHLGLTMYLLLSLDMWEEFIKPYHIRINDMTHNILSFQVKEKVDFMGHILYGPLL